MRIWHQTLIPHLCQKHLCAVWREALGCYHIITQNKQGYRNHPATQEFINYPDQLFDRLLLIREEMLHRGYHPKEIQPAHDTDIPDVGIPDEWQTLEEQKTLLKLKQCKCKI